MGKQLKKNQPKKDLPEETMRKVWFASLGALSILQKQAGSVLEGMISEGQSFVDDLDIDSLSMVEIAVQTEDKYGVKIPDEDLAGLRTVGDAVGYIQKLEAENADLAIARTRILPAGEIIGWKKCKSDVIVKLRIPADAARSHAFGRKCRAEFVDVIEGEGISSHDRKTKYAPGLRVTCDKWDENWQEECAGGVHFFITRLEAENY